MGNKRKKSKKNTSLYIFPIILAIIIFSYIFRYFYYNIETEVVKYDKIENTIDTQAIVVRREYVTVLPGDESNNYMVNEGDRVAFGAKLLEINKTSNTDANISLKISELNKRIEEIQKTDVDNNFFAADREKISSMIIDDVSAIKQVVESGNLKRLADVKKNLAGDLYKKSLIYGSGSFSGKNLEQLTKEKETLEQIYQNNMDVIYAQNDGIVSYTSDGYEALLNPNNIEAFNVGEMNELTNRLKNEEKNADNKNSAIRIVDNYEWYMCITLKDTIFKDAKKGNSIVLKLKDYDNEELVGQIAALTEPAEGQRLFTIRFEQQFEDFYKVRLVNVEIIKNYYEGFKVSTQNLTKKDDITGVYVNKDGIVKFIPVNIVAEIGKYTLVKNVSSKEQSSNITWGKLKEFDEVIKPTGRIKENQILPGKI